MSIPSIHKVAVIGSGVMGSGIAAHLANAGAEVLLLDIVKDGEANRSAIAEGAIARMLKTDPAPLMDVAFTKRITAGNLEDDLEKLRECDWIIEVVLERLDVKHATYAKIEAHRKAGSIVSSNTSTIPLHDLISGRSEDFKQHFVITHFFNPPRYMRLLELVIGKETLPEVVTRVSSYCDIALGKGVVVCNDRPGFIANRIGTFWLQSAINATLDLGLSVEEADAVGGKPMGIPKTAVFGLLDLIGLDLMPHLDKSLKSTLEPTDRYQVIARDWPLLGKLIADGYTGRKGKGGFYRMNKGADGTKTLEAINLNTGDYAPSTKVSLASVEAGKSGLKAVVTHLDKGGQFAKKVLVELLGYTAGLVPEIAGTVADVDAAMRLGYNWKHGPFQMIDALGAEWLAEELQAADLPVPKLLETAKGRTFYTVEAGTEMYLGVDGTYHPIPRADGVLLLSDIKRKGKDSSRGRVLGNGSASVWDIGDGVLCFEFHTKMNAIDNDTLGLLLEVVKLIKESPEVLRGLVIANDSDTFSAGANLGLFLYIINIALWPQIEEVIDLGHKAYQAIKYAPFPVVGAPSGLALGGGCEILLHCDAVQLHAETYMGLVETGVGLIPGWGGCKEMLRRANIALAADGAPKGVMPPTKIAFETIAMAKVSKSGFEAQKLFYLDGGVSMNRDRQLADAKARVLALLEDYVAPQKMELRLAGSSGAVALGLAVNDLQKQGQATPHDGVVTAHLAQILTGGENADPTEPVPESKILAFEKEQFMQLVKNPDSIARIEHMLETGKPLRN